MSADYVTTASRLAQNIANAWKIAGDGALSDQGSRELIKQSVKATELILILAQNNNVSNACYKNKVLEQVHTDIEQENKRLLEG